MGRPRKKNDEEVDFSQDDNPKKEAPQHSQEEIDEYNAKARDKILDLYAKREKITAQINEVRAGVKAMGTPKGEFDNALKDFLMDEDKREAKDQAYINCRRSFGIPINWVQPDMLGGPAVPLNQDAPQQSAH